jgi:hypothetical protein
MTGKTRIAAMACNRVIEKTPRPRDEVDNRPISARKPTSG